jgi:hypothetical protein
MLQNDGASTSQDTVAYMENQMALFGLQYNREEGEQRILSYTYAQLT